MIALEGEADAAAEDAHAVHALLERHGADVAAGAELVIPAGFAERGIYLASGSISLGGESLQAGELGLLAAEMPEARIHAGQASRLALLAGPTPDAHRILDWNFVSSRMERIRQARDDWQQGRFAAVPGESEFIPLPSRS